MTKLLSKEEYLTTFSGPNVEMETDSFDIPFLWNYVKEIPKRDYIGFEIFYGYIPFVYETADEKFEHVYVSTKTSNVFVVVLLDNTEQEVYGHILLDLNDEYDIEE